MRSRGQRVEPTAVVLARLAIVCVALAMGAAYLSWRATTLGSGWTQALALPVYAAELVAFADLVLLAIIARPRRSSATAPSTLRPADVEVDVVITVDNDDAIELERSLIAANRIMGLGRLRVVDPHHRPSFQLLATRSGARYLVDPRAAANPLAAAHRHSESDLYLWLSAGQVAASEVVVAAASQLRDERVAVCQVATNALNAEALAHLRRDHDDDHLVNHLIGPALHRWGVAPWSGSAALVRRAAVDDLVELADRLTPRRLTSRLHQQGWRTAFESRPLVGTVAPDRVDSFFVARRKQAADVWSLLWSSDGPAGRRLPIAARTAHLATAARFTAGLRLGLLTLILGVTLITGVVPVDAAPLVFISFWLPSAAAAALARRALTGGNRRVGEWVRLAWRSVDADLAGLVRALRGAHLGGSARVSDDNDGGTSFAAFAQLRVAYGAVLLLDLALLVRTLSVIDADIVPPFTAGWRIIVLALAVATLTPVLNVLQMVARRSQRRRHDRRNAVLPAALNGIPGTTVDLSPEGVGLLVPTEPRVGAPATLDVHLPAADLGINKVTASATVASVRSAGPGRWRVGVELVDLTEPAHHDLVEFWTLGPRIALDATAPQPASAERDRPFVGAVTATAMIGGLVTVLLGPAAGEAFAATPGLVETVCLADADGAPVAGATVNRETAEQTTPTAVTGEDGCAAVEPNPDTIGFALANGGERRSVELAEYQGERINARLRRTAIRVVLSDGVTAAPVSLRLFRDQWQPITRDADDGWTIETLLAEPPIEIRVDGRRHVRTVATGGEQVVVLARLVWTDTVPVANPARLDELPAIDTGLGWEPIVTPELVVLPGRVTLRLGDGSIVRLDVPDGHEVTLPAGEVRPRPDAVVPSSTSGTSVPVEEPPDTDSTTTTESVPTSEPPSTPPSTNLVTTTDPVTTSTVETSPTTTAPDTAPSSSAGPSSTTGASPTSTDEPGGEPGDEANEDGSTSSTSVDGAGG